VFATMYVRDHARVEFHKALGVDPTDYDFEVFKITSDISRQVFPLTLDLDNPAFHAALERLLRISERMAAAERQGGVMGKLRKAGLVAAAGVGFLRLYLIPAKRNDLPRQVRLSPAW
jgi:magnesium-protoporphyrin IX monomethyl ester (oxidative) cyclase